jgi:putative ABC transport system substrate-binding protein
MTNQARRRALLLGAGALVALPRAALAQRVATVARVGFLSAASAATYSKNWDFLKETLRDAGYVEGKSIEFEVRWADGASDRLPELARELVRRKLDVIVTHGTPGALTLKQATPTIPIVCVGMSDPMASGLVASLARPGANITGFSILSEQLYEKRLALLKEAVPRIRRVAFLMNPGNPVYGPMFKSMQAMAKSVGIEAQRFDLRGVGDLKIAFAAMAKARIDALVIAEDSGFFAYAASICEFAVKQQLPSGTASEFVRSGALIGYGINRADLFRRAANYVDQILKGAKPGDLPIQQPTKFEFLINLKTAKALGIAIPSSVLLRADQVIE